MGIKETRITELNKSFIIILTSDDDGGAPVTHITQILGSTDLDLNEVLASSVLAYANEPKSGTMLQVNQRRSDYHRKIVINIPVHLFIVISSYTLQWQELQMKARSMIGPTWTEQTLKPCILNLWDRDKLIGHKEADICDPRYTALLNFAKQHLPDNSELKVY